MIVNGQIVPQNSCVCQDIFSRLEHALKISAFERSDLLSIKTLLLQHSLAFQGMRMRNVTEQEVGKRKARDWFASLETGHKNLYREIPTIVRSLI